MAIEDHKAEVLYFSTIGIPRYTSRFRIQCDTPRIDIRQILWVIRPSRAPRKRESGIRIRIRNDGIEDVRHMDLDRNPANLLFTVLIPLVTENEIKVMGVAIARNPDVKYTLLSAKCGVHFV